MWRPVVTLVLVLLLGLHEAWPCSISPEPNATVFGPTDRTQRGHRPWIRLWNVKPNEKVIVGVAPPCPTRNKCPDPKPLAIDRDGAFIRPKEMLPAGATIWVQLPGSKKTLETFQVSSSEAKQLPAWSGMVKPIATTGREGLCSPSGPLVKMRVLPTKADLSDAVLLVYTKKPDPKRLLSGLGAIYLLGVGELELHNNLGDIWMAKKPTRLWTAIADGDGNVGPIVEHAFDMRAEAFGAKDAAEPRGTRPWIRVWGATKGTPLSIQTVDASCDPSAACAPTLTAAFDRSGDYLRPKNPLPNGSRVQVVSRQSVLLDFTVRTGAGKTLPTIPFTLGAPAGSSPGSCPTPNMVAPDISQTDTDFVAILLYATPPDPANPLANLTAILKFGGRWLDFGAFGNCVFKKLPRKLWTILATDDGVVGTPVEHDLSPPKLGTGGLL